MLRTGRVAKVLGNEREACTGGAPHREEIVLHRGNPLVVEAVQPAGALGPVGHQARVLQKAKVARNRRAADRQAVGQFLNGPVPRPQELDDGAPVRIPEGIERISVVRVLCDCAMVTTLLP